MSSILIMSLAQMKKIDELDKTLKRMYEENSEFFDDNPEEMTRALSILTEINQNQLRLSQELGNLVRRRKN